jgi:hypothetical protein
MFWVLSQLFFFPLVQLSHNLFKKRLRDGVPVGVVRENVAQRSDPVPANLSSPSPAANAASAASASPSCGSCYGEPKARE